MKTYVENIATVYQAGYGCGRGAAEHMVNLPEQGDAKSGVFGGWNRRVNREGTFPAARMERIAWGFGYAAGMVSMLSEMAVEP